MASRNRDRCRFALVALCWIVPAAASRAEDGNAQPQLSWHISAGHLVRLAPIEADQPRLRIPLDLSGRQVQLELEPSHVRGDDFCVIVANGGVEIPIVPPRSQTWRGRLSGEATSHVVASISPEGQLTALIVRSGGAWSVQPIGEEDTRAHLVFRTDGILPSQHVCGVDDSAPLPDSLQPESPAPDGSRQTCQPNPVVQIAFDADYEFFVANNASVSETVADIEAILNTITSIYEREVGIRFEISRIVVRSDEADPYTANGHIALLDQMANEWITNQIAVPRDMAHLMTGRDLIGFTIGYANIGVLCSLGAGYGLSQSTFSPVFLERVVLTAHEIGHNLAGVHCNTEPDCAIMCASLNSCGGFGDPPRFAAFSRQLFVNHVKQNENCVDRIQLCEADLNCDGSTDFDDFAILTNCWGTGCGDLTGDGRTDFDDFGVLIASWECGYPFGVW